MILDIIGKESPVVEGLGVGESGNYEEVEVTSVHGVVFGEDEVAAFHSAREDYDEPETGASCTDPGNRALTA